MQETISSARELPVVTSRFASVAAVMPPEAGAKRPSSQRAAAQPSVGVAALWGRAKIEAVSDQLRRGADPQSVRDKIVEIALAHHLLSEHTALIAVDPMPARPADARFVSANVPLNLPAGWRYESVFGDASLTQMIRFKLRDQEAALALPSTALGIDGKLLIGLMFLLGAAALAVAFRAPERKAAA